MNHSNTVRPLSSAEPTGGIRDTSGQDTVIKRSRWKQWVIAAGVAIIAIIGVAMAKPALERWWSGDHAVARERVRVASVERGPFTRDISIQGTVVAAISPTVFAPSPGTVDLKVQAGDQVAVGTELATVASPELANQLAQEQATLDSLELNLQRQELDNRQAALANEQQADLAQLALVAAERELRRAQQSWDRKLISVQDLEKARDDVDSARINAEHSAKKAELDNESLAFELKSLRLQRDRQQLLVSDLGRQNEELTLRSPVDGVVGNLLVDQRTQVLGNSPLMTVVDLTAFEIDAAVPESYSDDVGIGMEASLSYGGQPYAAQVAAISPEVNNGAVNVRLRFAAQKPAGLRQNQRLSGRIVLQHKEDVLMVDRGAFLQSGGGRIAYVVRDDVAERRTIRIGSSSVSKIEIIDGLSQGDQIIISSTDAFRDAETVLLND